MLRFLKQNQNRVYVRHAALQTRNYNRHIAGNEWLEKYMSTVNKIFKHITEDEGLQKLAASRYIDGPSWKSFVNTFRRRIIKEPTEAMGSQIALQDFTAKLDDTIAKKDDTLAIPAFGNYVVESVLLPRAEVELKEVIESYRLLSTATDLRVPHEWYPKTRLMKRKIIYHGGPTNSGKTYQALKRLAEADPAKGGGLYCGPLRLLALEVYEKLNKQGVYTDLLTGQERREVPGATHISATVEMVSLTKEYDVVVIDEIQMIADSARGYSWTRALLGLQANEIHVCGGLESLKVVESLMNETRDDFRLESYNRLSKLEIEPESLKGDYSKVEPGDCVVVFSKKDIFSVRREIERKTKYKCAIIYGALPAETRSTQARLFNEENTGYDVLVASDAIGMGLNLNIRRIVFHTTAKFTQPHGIGYLSESHLKQIAGRAGRLSSQYDVGKVTAWQEVDLAYVRAVMQHDVPQVSTVGIFPSVEQIEHFSTHMEKHRLSQLAAAADEEELEGLEDQAVSKGEKPEKTAKPTALATLPSSVAADSLAYQAKFSLSKVLEQFVELSRLEGRFHLCEHDSMVVVSNWLQPIPLTIADRFTFATAPVNTGDAVAMLSLYDFAAKYALHQPVALNLRLSRDVPQDLEEFTNLCVKHDILELYVWLALRFPKYFVEAENCVAQKNFAIQQIEAYMNDENNMTENTHEEMYVKTRKRLPSQIPKVACEKIQKAIVENFAKIDEKDLFVVPDAAMNARKKNFNFRSQSNGRNGEWNERRPTKFRPPAERSVRTPSPFDRLHKNENSSRSSQQNTTTGDARDGSNMKAALASSQD